LSARSSRERALKQFTRQLWRASRNPALGKIDLGLDWRLPYHGTICSLRTLRPPTGHSSELQRTCAGLRRWNNLRCLSWSSNPDSRDEIGVYFCLDVLARDALFQSEMRNLVMTRMKMPACVDRGYTNINLMLQMIAMAMASYCSRFITHMSLLFGCSLLPLGCPRLQDPPDAHLKNLSLTTTQVGRFR
jgi:hypothetical protein